MEVIKTDNPVMGAGNFIGEVALLTEGKRTATVRAVDCVEMQVLDKHDLESVFVNFPEYYEKM